VLHEVVPCLRVQRYGIFLNAPNIWADIFIKKFFFARHIINILQFNVTLYLVNLKRNVNHYGRQKKYFGDSALVERG
jgi:hypothetical protein